MKATIFGVILVSIVSIIPGSTTTYVREEDPPPQSTYEVVKAEISAYTSSPDETWGDPFITASGDRTRSGVIACPARLEFGTIVEISGRKYICKDRMNSRYRDRNVFDIWMEEKELAYEWGRRHLEVKIYQDHE